MKRLLHTTGEVIDKLGGTAQCQRRYRQKRMSNVSNWKAAEVFPPNLYHAMTDDLAALGCEAPPTLWQQVEPDPTVEGFPPSSSDPSAVSGEEGGAPPSAEPVNVDPPEMAR